MTRTRSTSRSRSPALGHSRLLATVLVIAGAGLAHGAATAAASDGSPAELPVGHTIKRVAVPGTVVNEMRQVDVHLWYPADPQDAAARPMTVYASALHGKPLGNDRAPLSWSVEAETAREGAAIDLAGGPYAPIVFSHGATNDPIDYAHTLEAIADAGFIVVAPAHTNNTQDDLRLDYINALNGTRLFPCQDGLPARPVPTLMANGFPTSDCAKASVPNSMSDRARDVSAVLDELSEWFGDDVDVQRAGVIGHSRGTVTALAAAGGSIPWRSGGTPAVMCAPAQPEDDLCWEDVQPEPRVKAIMGMAIGAMAINNSVNFAAITTPTLLVYGGKDINTMPANTSAAFGQIPATTDRTIVPPLDVTIPHPLRQATHRSFDSTYCAQLQSAGAAFDTDGDGVVEADTIPPETANTSRPLDRWTFR